MAPEEKHKFDVKAATKILEEVVKKVLKEATYRSDLVQEWQSTIYQETIARLTTHLKGGTFKFIVTSTFLESIGAGVHISSTSLWDAESDGAAVYRFENKSMIVIVYAFGLSV
ncbi:Tctex-1 [Linnemannia elongata]|uniref:Tctex-1 n=1 Tax=Linnemannia elongata AG-77 TaxID=1314771 RepID=A0A197JLY3_9FUNG|nr:Dynein light chain Tctex-type [Linnemannia elongata]OAQ26150.1 Tctex-1 [Linnemannia elongata AG-77]KAF9327282.1 Dynein light chain Tctex-type [Linnemannia elongata]KAG0067281.1 Dynein light chain Tctex-type [Linnemannia elongata]KAG0074196.1 Dynein light chain Tctex-type [Linnemannia elongata]